MGLIVLDYGDSTKVGTEVGREVRKASERKAHLYSLEREGRASHVRVRAYAYMRLLSPLQE